MELEKKILAASVEMFFSHGIKAVSMDDVAKAVGISKRTLYEHFGSKDALLMGCIDVIQEQKSTLISKLIDESNSFIELILKCVYEAIGFAQNISPRFFEDLSNLNYRGARVAMDKSFVDLKDRTVGLISKGKEDGLIREEIDPEFTATMMIHGTIPKPMEYSAGSNKWDRAWMLKQLTFIFLRGMATEKGTSLIDKYAKGLKLNN